MWWVLLNRLQNSWENNIVDLDQKLTFLIETDQTFLMHMWAGSWVHKVNTQVGDTNATVQTREDKCPPPNAERQDLPRWAPAAGWWCAASLVSVGSCPGPRASPSRALSACTAAVYRCISSASPAGSNREQGTEGRGRLECTAGEGDSFL